ncbi:CdaR family protein [Mariniflexile aquimaris]|uniref:CdaR family protein n=1 Tax=Mariniflexile aquimaris TaxID=881009 RepID=A0ABW3BT68_9FLAO
MLRKLRSDILTSIKNKKINVFFLFLLLAVVILLFTKLSKDYTKTIAFSIEKINVPQENIILKDSTPLYITLKTNGFNWLRFYFSKAKIKIDFSKDVTKNDKLFIWNKSKAYIANTQFDKNIELLNIYPETLVFRYGENMVKKVPVKLNSTIEFMPGFNMSKPLVLEPDSVVVVGPKALVNSINYIETVKAQVSNVKADLNETVKLKLPKKSSDITFSNETIQLKAQVEKFTEGTLKIPVTLINVPEKIQLKFYPKEVSVSYYVSLSNFSAVTKKDFEIICDYNKILKNQYLMVPELSKYPEFVKNVKINQQRIEFIIIE